MENQHWGYAEVAVDPGSWQVVSAYPASRFGTFLKRLGAGDWELVQFVGPTGTSPSVFLPYLKRPKA